VISRRSRDEILKVIREGTGRMPAFGAAIDGGAINDIVNYLITGRDASVGTVGTSPYALPYRTAFFDIFVDHEGYPGIRPPWGTLNAIDLNTGEYRWTVPLGEYPELTAQGVPVTGTENYGGPIATASGLVFIGATNYDKKFRAFDAGSGAVLWETTLPFAGNATPATYAVGGRQFVVIPAGGGKARGAASGGVYVAFALPK
jgi:quinoprotein glucose dehydrogenase